MENCDSGSNLKSADFQDFGPQNQECAKKANLWCGHLYLSGVVLNHFIIKVFAKTGVRAKFDINPKELMA